jgi:hypothetical protein
MYCTVRPAQYFITRKRIVGAFWSFRAINTETFTVPAFSHLRCLLWVIRLAAGEDKCSLFFIERQTMKPSDGNFSSFGVAKPEV